ncbi:hypothetical protein [Vibrio metschnikovii]|uniref:hypothetical protein n=1 Tax=Vibrio metschnikovii TaxID=28172 RepID=UPI001C3038AB|nr:hypothetical protein [Vibrio metschnikovii]
MKKLIKATLSALLIVGGISTQAFAMDEKAMIQLAKQTEFRSCSGRSLEQIINRSVNKAKWSAVNDKSGGKSVTIQGNFKQSGALMGMQFAINEDDSLRLRIMLVNGLVKSQDDSLVYFTRMCKGQSL